MRPLLAPTCCAWHPHPHVRALPHAYPNSNKRQSCLDEAFMEGFFLIVKIIIDISFNIYKSLIKHVEITSDPDHVRKPWVTICIHRTVSQDFKSWLLEELIVFCSDRVLAIFPLKPTQIRLHCPDKSSSLLFTWSMKKVRTSFRVPSPPCESGSLFIRMPNVETKLFYSVSQLEGQHAQT